jgi:hypothetical protein
VLFEEVQDPGDCGITGRFAGIRQASRPWAVDVNNIQEDINNEYK